MDNNNLKQMSKITAILRNYSNEELDCFLEAAQETNIHSIEIAISDKKKNLEQINHAQEKFGKNYFIGAGTVTNIELLHEAISAGAKFVLSPIMMTPEMVSHCQAQGIISIPGALTPTEIWQSASYGADIIKIFPIGSLGKGYAKKINDPMPSLRLMAVGGVNQNNSRELLESGFTYLGIGSNLCSEAALKSLNKELIIKEIQAFEQKISVA